MDHHDEEILEHAVFVHVLRLKVLVNGLALGLLAGLGLFAATIILVLRGGPVVGPHLGLLSNYFPGYDVTWLGSLIGFGYGFVLGFLVGASVAFFYNVVVGFREQRRRRSAGE